MRKFWLTCIFLFYCSTPVKAAIELSIGSVLESVEENTPFSIPFSLSQGTSANSIVYLRAVLYKEGTTKYFGYTQNQNNEWINSTSDKSQFYELTVSSEGTASGEIFAKLDMENSYFEGSGVYKIKLGRYTSATDSGADWSNEQEIAVIGPTPSPTPSTTPTPTPTPIQTPTPSLTPSPTSTPKPSVKPSPSPDLVSPTPGTVAGESTEIDLSGFGVSPSPSLQGVSLKAPTINKSRVKTVLLIGSGLVLVTLASFFGYRRYLATIKK